MPSLRHRIAHFTLKKLGLFDRSYREDHFGRNFIIPIINGRKTYVMEPWMAEMIRHLFSLKPGGFVDVGVNLGQTLLKVAAIDPARDYVGFEPNPSCVDYVWRLVGANGLPHRIFPVGLSNRTTIETLYLYRTEDTDPSASMVEQFRPGVASTRAIVTFRVSDLPPDAIPDTIAIVKIDVEGGESFVLDGMEQLLATKRPFVLVEILPASAEEKDRLARQRTIETLLSKIGYAMFRIVLGDAGKLNGIERIAEIGVVDDLMFSDYLFVPEEEAESLAILAR